MKMNINQRKKKFNQFWSNTGIKEDKRFKRESGRLCPLQSMKRKGSRIEEKKNRNPSK
jgi:hypothetical protein